MIAFTALYTNPRVIGREKELAQFVLGQMAEWDNPKATEIIIESMRHFADEYGMTAEMALVSAYTYCVVGSMDQTEGTCQGATTESPGTKTGEPSISGNSGSRPSLSHRVAKWLGGFFGVRILRRLKHSAISNYRSVRRALSGVRLRKPLQRYRSQTRAFGAK